MRQPQTELIYPRHRPIPLLFEANPAITPTAFRPMLLNIDKGWRPKEMGAPSSIIHAYYGNHARLSRLTMPRESLADVNYGPFAGIIVLATKRELSRFKGGRGYAMHRSFPPRESQHRAERKVRPFGPQVLIGCGHGSKTIDRTGSQRATRDHRKKNKFCAKRNHASA